MGGRCVRCARVCEIGCARCSLPTCDSIYFLCIWNSIGDYDDDISRLIFRHIALRHITSIYLLQRHHQFGLETGYKPTTDTVVRLTFRFSEIPQRRLFFLFDPLVFSVTTLRVASSFCAFDLGVGSVSITPWGSCAPATSGMIL